MCLQPSAPNLRETGDPETARTFPPKPFMVHLDVHSVQHLLLLLYLTPLSVYSLCVCVCLLPITLCVPYCLSLYPFTVCVHVSVLSSVIFSSSPIYLQKKIILQNMLNSMAIHLFPSPITFHHHHTMLFTFCHSPTLTLKWHIRSECCVGASERTSPCPG